MTSLMVKESIGDVYRARQYAEGCRQLESRRHRCRVTNAYRHCSSPDVTIAGA